MDDYQYYKNIFKLIEPRNILDIKIPCGICGKMHNIKGIYSNKYKDCIIQALNTASLELHSFDSIILKNIHEEITYDIDANINITIYTHIPITNHSKMEAEITELKEEYINTIKLEIANEYLTYCVASDIRNNLYTTITVYISTDYEKLCKEKLNNIYTLPLLILDPQKFYKEEVIPSVKAATEAITKAFKYILEKLYEMTNKYMERHKEIAKSTLQSRVRISDILKYPIVPNNDHPKFFTKPHITIYTTASDSLKINKHLEKAYIEILTEYYKRLLQDEKETIIS
ncbi:MAG: hypothetical protein ACPLRZ_11610 [Thermovenabulum sp.]|uniref:hypothetical protein n=1 Tax=Thermovenabulum sp. TaxID=3100335 RepID=UPI003C7B53E9